MAGCVGGVAWPPPRAPTDHGGQNRSTTQARPTIQARPTTQARPTIQGAAVQIAIVLYDRFTALDAVGPYEVLSRLPGAQVVFVAERTGLIANELGSLRLSADATLAEVPQPDIVLAPGGPGQAAQMDGPLSGWLRETDRHTRWTTAVCTGSLLLAGAGLLTGRRATTHWTAMRALAALGATATTERVVADGKYLTGAGVSAGIDLALSLAGRIAGDEVAQGIQLAIEYDPRPPYAAGSPDTAPEHVVAAQRAGSRFAPAGR